MIDGQIGLVGSDEAGLRAAVAQARAAGSGIPVTLTRDGDRVVARVGAQGGARVGDTGSGPARVLLVGFDPSHATRVLRGENAGLTLEQANIVRSLQDLGPWSGTPETFASARPEGETAALLLQAPNGRVLGAARLDPPGPVRESLR